MEIQKSGESEIRFFGDGTGKQTTDDCSVDFYLKLKAGNEPDLICENVQSGASILELGCGVGRVTHELIRRGLSVTAVDNSADMLAHVEGAETVQADIETLELNATYDAVILGSFLLNSPNQNSRGALLSTCRKHVSSHAVVFIECHPYSQLEKISAGFKGEHDGIRTAVDSLEKKGSVVDLRMRWEIENETWTQTFTTEMLDENGIKNELHLENLQFVR